MRLLILSPIEDRRLLFLPEVLSVFFFEWESNPLREVARTMAVVERVKRTPTAAPMAMCLLFSESDSSMACLRVEWGGMRV